MRSLSARRFQSPVRNSSSRRRHSSKPVRDRRLSLQSLETRYLLAAEGLPFDVNRTFPTGGLVGSLSSTITWGDNTQTAGTVSGVVDNDGPLSIKFEYVGSFFNDPARKVLLQNVAASVVERFGDDLEAITPTSFLTWNAVTSNPTTGAELKIPNLVVAENELVIYVGARNLPGNQVGEAFPGFAETSFTGLYTPEQIAEITAWQKTLQFRGETGADQANPTDIGPWGGFISFDSDTNWHFGATTDGLDDDEVDFSTVVVHEMMHVLGFGVNYSGPTNSSYDTVTDGLSFIGPKTRALYGGDVPLRNAQHFADDVESNGQQSVITANVDKGTRKIITPLDFASLDDIGWTLRSAPSATVTGSHVYADNPETGNTFPVEVVLRGSQFGEVTQSLTSTVTNTPPTLSVPPNQSVQVDRGFTFANIGELSDPGFTRASSNSTETFTYTINWGDGTTDSGDATIDRVGNGTLTTLASFDGSHTYDAVGTYNVGITVMDDDGGTDTESFTITVTPPPQLTLQVSTPNITEDDGPGAATLTVTRSGPVQSAAQTITLSSSDTSEANLAGTVVIPANASSVTTPINAVDDTLLDGTQIVTLTASGVGTESGEVNLNVTDVEFLTANFQGGNITEADTTSVVLVVRRSNTDDDEPLTVNISGGDASQLTVPSQVTIAAGQRSVLVPLVPVQDEQAELTKTLDFVLAATNYTSASATVDILDDEPPFFQNPDDRFNADGTPGLTPNDILVVINQLAEEGASVQLDPETRAFTGVYFDVDGNGILSPNDILEVINELARAGQPGTEVPGGELIDDERGVSSNASVPLRSVSLSASINDVDDDEDDEETTLDLIAGI